MNEEDKEFVNSLRTQCIIARENFKDTCCQLPISYIEKIIFIVYKQQKELEKLKRLNKINESIIELLKDKTSIQENIICSFESGEMIGGKKYEE